MILFKTLCRNLLTLSLLLAGSEAIPAQNPIETKTGTITKVTQKGRLVQLVVKDDQGDELELLITPKVEFQIQSTGDKGFVTKGQFLQGTGTLSNQKIFLSEVTVHIVLPGRKSVKRGGIVPAKAQAGQSKNSYLVSGTIAAHQTDKDYPDYELIAIREAARGPFLMLKKDVKIKVVSSDISLLPKNAKIRMEGIPLRSGRFNLKKATVQLSKALKSEDLLRRKP